MASTYTLISSNTLAASAASVTFSSIPSTYTDLVLRCSIRTDVANTIDNVDINFNGDTATNYSETYVRGDGSAASSGRHLNKTFAAGMIVNGGSSTASTFTNFELYLPSYTAAQSKPWSAAIADEANTATGVYSQAVAQLYRSNSAISSIVLTSDSAANFVSGSSFYLYGIKNS